MASGRAHNLETIAKWVRAQILRSTTAAGSGHPTSSLSAADLLVGLFFGGHFRARLAQPDNPGNDRFILSKGHAAPLLYAIYAAAGKVSERELRTLRKLSSRLEGHPTPRFPYVDVATGSLGQGLSVGVGMALAGAMHHASYRTYVLLGDGETAEGSVWEAMSFAAHRKLHRLVAILDMNRLGQSGPTALGWRDDVYARRARAFGWRTIVIDGHDFKDIDKAFRFANGAGSAPTMIIAKTVKGRGVSFLENRNGWHGRALTPAQLSKALTELAPIPPHVKAAVTPSRSLAVRPAKKHAVSPPRYERGAVVSPREAFGRALLRLAPGQPAIVALDGDVKNSTYTELLQRRFPKQFIEGFIAEQNMVGLATGLAARGHLPVVATFAAFLTRAHDQLRMLQYSGHHVVVAGTHVGVAIGQDGPSQMGLEDIALFRSLQNATVLYPADAYATERLTERALAGQGIMYLRLTRQALPLLYTAATPFPIGGSHVLRTTRRDQATIVAAGVTVHEALKAADLLKAHNVQVRVIDCYSVQPIDQKTLRQAARATKHVIVVEDHVGPGGLGEAVRTALGPDAGMVVSLAVHGIPRSGRPEELLARSGLTAPYIARKIQRIL